MNRIWSILVCLSCCLMGYGQDGSIPVPKNAPDSILFSTVEDVSLDYYHIDNPNKHYSYKDTALNSFTHNYDPARLRPIDYIHLGNQGSAAHPLKFGFTPNIGFCEGHRQYDLYHITMDNFRFYDGNTPLTNVSFTPMGSQENFVVTADFARRFTDGFAISSNYKRILQKGQYANQKTRITNFGASLRYESKNKKYQGYLTMLSNADQEENNGAPIDAANYQLYSRNNRELIPTKLENASTRHQQKYYSLTNYYTITDNDTLAVKLQYNFGIDNRYYKYSDESTTSSDDSIVYKNLLVDFRGIRYLTKVDRINNSFYTHLSTLRNTRIKAGIVYDRYSIDQDSVSSTTQHNVFLDLDGTLPISQSMMIRGKGQLGLADGTGDYNLDGTIRTEIGKNIVLQGGFTLFKSNPSLLQTSLYLTEKQIWDTTFEKPSGNILSAAVQLPSLHFKASIEQYSISNPIYFDTLGYPQQATEKYGATVFSLQQDIHLGIFHLENQFLLQRSNQNLYGLPTYWSRHNLYAEFYMFKRNLRSRWGVEARFNTAFDGLAYQPASGIFHLSNAKTRAYPMIDLYFSGKVDQFRTFIKLENLNQVIYKNKIDTRIYGYPTQDWSIRFGVSWLFLR